MQDIISQIKKKWQTVAILIFMVVAIVFSVSTFIPAKYSSQVKMIIIQSHRSENVDAFSAAKSAEYLSNIVSNVVFTESFIRDMLDAPFEVKKNSSYSSEERMKIWEKTVDVKKENNTGILTITVFNISRDEAERIAESITWGLNTRGSKYHGGGDSIEIKTVDGPITSEKPVTPNVLLNTLLALIVGAIGAISVVHFFDDFELVLFRKREFNEDDLESQDKSVKKIVANLEQIRENLKKQKSAPLAMEDYSIEKFDDKNDLEFEGIVKIEETPFIEELQKDEIIQEEKIEKTIVEEKPVEKGKTEIVKNSSVKKAEAPKNLPIFKEEKLVEKAEVKAVEKKVDKGFITMEELNQEAEKMGLTDNKKEDNSKYEASGEEVKERLNKLLRGEL